MKASISIFCIWLIFSNVQSNSEPPDFCEIVRSTVAAENLEHVIQHESKIIGHCNTVVYETDWLKEKYKLKLREYKCDDWRIALFTFEDMFGEHVTKAIQFDKIAMKANKLNVTYSIIEFFDNGKKGFDKRTLLTKTIKLRKKEGIYK